MNIWIVFIGEELPIDGKIRPWRYGILADILSNRGHQVTRWAPTFYMHKKQRSLSDLSIPYKENYRINLIYDRGYKKNISFGRIRHYERLAKKFFAWSRREPVPDIILAGLPSPSMVKACINYGKMHHVPVVVDVRDLWPDIFLDVVPKMLKPLGRMYLWPSFRKNRFIFRQAAGILGIMNNFVQWGLNYAERTATPFDASFTHAYREIKLTPPDIAREDNILRTAGLNFEKPIICFFGTFEESNDLETVIDAAHILNENADLACQFVLCGDGEKKDALKQRAGRIPNVFFLGRVQQPRILRIMQRASIGLACYIKSFKYYLPNKVIEYFCGGLAVIASRNKEMQGFLDENYCGLTYEPQDAKSLAESIRCLLSDRDLLNQMKKNARSLYEKAFTPEHVYGKMAEHIEYVYENKKLISRPQIIKKSPPGPQ